MTGIIFFPESMPSVLLLWKPLLEELRVMDDSLLLGVHYRSPGYASSPQVTDKVNPYL